MAVTRPDPLWKRAVAFCGRLAEVCYVLAVFLSHVIADDIEYAARNVAARLRAHRRRRRIRHRVFAVTRSRRT